MRLQAGVILNALDRLALALADHEHDWTAEERRAYERVVALCLSRRAIDSKVREKALSRTPCPEPQVQSAQA